LINRAKDNWTPLFAIAEVVGGHWPRVCREAASAFQNNRPDETSKGAILLADIQDLFRNSDGNALRTEDILSQLAKMEERAWGEWKKGKPMTAVSLARLLKPFGIRPRTIRFGDETQKGYDPVDFQDAFTRYIRTQIDSDPSQPSQVNEFTGLNPFFDPEHDGNVTGAKQCLNSGIVSSVTDVTDRDPWE
jgi:hypothetical protein